MKTPFQRYYDTFVRNAQAQHVYHLELRDGTVTRGTPTASGTVDLVNPTFLFVPADAPAHHSSTIAFRDLVGAWRSIEEYTSLEELANDLGPYEPAGGIYCAPPPADSD